ncbi:hypothetical protein BGY98DRAFT_940630 [Russula aff. rugulosa BPL654]|nr:hypothetical protein BGY98DRAFT_940630 [Russula aff. rugulosa BPL654]
MHWTWLAASVAAAVVSSASPTPQQRLVRQTPTTQCHRPTASWPTRRPVAATCSSIHHSVWFLRVPTPGTLQPLASPTTLAGLNYLHYPYAEAFGMPVPSIHGSALLGFLTSTLAAPMAGYTSAAPTR